jgi:hypothetical protein
VCSSFRRRVTVSFDRNRSPEIYYKVMDTAYASPEVDLQQDCLLRSTSLTHSATTLTEITQCALLEIFSAFLQSMEIFIADLYEDNGSLSRVGPILTIICSLNALRGLERWADLTGVVSRSFRMGVEVWRVRVHYMLDQIVTDTGFYREFYQFLRDSYENPMSPAQRQNTASLGGRKIRQCLQQSERLDRMAHVLRQRVLSGFEDSKGLFEIADRQSERLQSRSSARLSWMAAIFLPFSLAASIMSLQFRVSELHAKLYDFFGLAVFLTLLVIIAMYIEQQVYAGSIGANVGHVDYLYAMNDIARRKSLEKYFRWMSDSLKWYVWTFWMVLFASFIVGMKKDIHLGWKVLRYGSIPHGAILVFFLLPFYVRSRRDGLRWAKAEEEKLRASAEES